MIYIFHKMSHIAIKFRNEFKVRTTLQTNSHRHITSHRRTNPIDLGEYRMNSFFFTGTRGPCPLLALLVNPRLQGLRPLQSMLAKPHLFLANVEQILIGFVYMRDEEKK